MVFPSIPIYLDPTNWSQQRPNQQEGIDTRNLQILPPQQPPSSTISVVEDGGYQSSIRPGSMVDRARLAKIHQPDAALKCPRCESTNTKFCYYNNYNLSQPRHFCKTCRRYWTRGGALRNVPVGGGCRRNKRSKGSSSSSSNRSSKSSMKAAAGSSSASANSSSSGCTNSTTDVIGHFPTPSPQTHYFPFLPTLQHSYSDYIFGGNGLNFGTFPTSMVARNGNNTRDAEFQIGTSSSGGNNGLNSEQWRLPNLQQVHHQQQFPFLTNLEPQIGLFKIDGENAEPPPSYVRDGGGIRFCSNKALDSTSVSGVMPQVNNIKMEENQGLSLSKNNVLGSSGNEIFWSGSGDNAWCEVPSFTSSTSHML